jgi:AraC family transcriptional regulator of adaptative response/methylated-DNA-[protein]-cysteine methyltransferase
MTNKKASAEWERQDTALWNQVVARERGVAFVYAVRTTGVYCRPGCPSRLPARRNVVFFANGEEARAAGFRACLRCAPDVEGSAGASRAAAIAGAARYLADRCGEGGAGAEITRRTGLNRLAVLRGFRQVLGVTPGEFSRASKFVRLRDELTGVQGWGAAATLGSSPAGVRGAGASTRRSETVTEAIYAAGFGSSSRVYERGEASLGMGPRAMREGAGGVTIRYTTAESPLGLMLVAATDAGVCAILFGANAEELLSDLRRRFPKAELVAADGGGGWLSDAVAFVASQLTEHPLARGFPIDLRATAFQQRVWDALLAIPRGETRCYSEIAREIGRPQASRAVGAAIGMNPLAVVVPCHRAIGKDGSLTGYHWGLDRKRRLLAAEHAPE